MTGYVRPAVSHSWPRWALAAGLVLAVGDRRALR
jgi:hypothetical protein